MIVNGIEYKDYWKSGDGREVCHELKKGNMEAVGIMARFFYGQGIFSKGSILVPAPQHTGNAEYTLKVAEAIALNTGATVADVLKCVPRETLYKQKALGKKLHTDLFLSGAVPNGEVFFIDNCVATGRTFFDSQKLLGKMIPIAYAFSRSL